MSYNSHERRSHGVDTALVIRFIATSFIYLFAGLIFLTLNIAGILDLNRDAIFILWLFGFVAMIVFGLSYMFASGLISGKGTAQRFSCAFLKAVSSWHRLLQAQPAWFTYRWMEHRGINEVPEFLGMKPHRENVTLQYLLERHLCF